jgi:DNA-binding beta-propeller fold protein YncE
LNNPYGIALDSNTGTIYIADNMNQRVMSYASGASSGTVVAGGNGNGISPSQLSLPFGIYFDSFSNSLTIVNSDQNTVVRWVLGASNWTLLAGNINGTAGNTSTFLNGPRGVTLDPMGNLYVADALNHRIQLFMSGQTDGITIMGTTGVMGSNATLFNRPYSVAFDGQLNIYVADAHNYRIQKFVRY